MSYATFEGQFGQMDAGGVSKYVKVKKNQIERYPNANYQPGTLSRYPQGIIRRSPNDPRNLTYVRSINPATQNTTNQLSTKQKADASTPSPHMYKIVVDGTATFKKDFGLIVVGAIIFIASFLWKDFISDFRDQYFPKHMGMGVRFIYILVVTCMLLILAVLIRNIFGLTNGKSPQFDDAPEEDDHPIMPTLMPNGDTVDVETH